MTPLSWNCTKENLTIKEPEFLEDFTITVDLIVLSGNKK